MGIPAGGVSRVELDEADAALNHATCEEAACAEFGGFLLVDAVHLEGGGRFVLDIDEFGGSGLHSEGKFIGLDFGSELIIVLALLEVLLIEFADEVDDVTLLCG